MPDANLKPLSISAVVVNHNGGENILKSVNALLGQSTPLDQIVVVDNASQDGSPERLKAAYPSVNVIQNSENIGLSAARNLGIQNASAELVLILDDDVYLETGTLSTLQDSLETSGASVVCPRILLYPQTEIVQCDGASPHFIGNMTLRNAYQPASSPASAAEEVGAAIGACLLAKKDALQHAGGFNPEFFFYFEDLEFSLRMRALGHTVVCQPAAIVYHEKGAGTPGLSFRGTGAYPERRLYYTLRHRWLILSLIYRKWTLVVLSPALLLYELGGLATAIKSRQFRIWRQALRSLIEIRPKIRQQRKFIQANRTIGDRSLLESPPLFFAPGFVTSRTAGRAVKALSAFFRIYWKIFSPLIRK